MKDWKFRVNMSRIILLFLGLVACGDGTTTATTATPTPDREQPDAGVDLVVASTPQIQNLPSRVVAPPGEVSVFAVMASPPDPDEVLSYSVWSTTCPFEPEMDSEYGFLSWVCPAQDLECDVEIEVRDEHGGFDRNSLFISCLRGAPFFLSTPSAQAEEDNEYIYDASCEDVDGNPAQIIKGADDTCGGHMLGNTYVWTPGEMKGGGKCFLELICSNDVGSSAQTEWVSVAETNRPPIFSNLPAIQSTRWGRRGGIELFADDPDYPPVNIGMKLLSTTCDFPLTLLNERVVSYTCGTTLGTCSAQFEVSDGQAATQGSLTIACTNSAPEIRAAAVAPIQASGEPLTCTYDFYDGDDDEDKSTIEWLVDGVVVGTRAHLELYAEGDLVSCRVTPADAVSVGTSFESPPVVVPPRLIIAVGEEHVCVRTRAGGVRCWGDNSFGRVGAAGAGILGPTTPIGLGSGVSSLAVGASASCAIQGGDLKCWGDGSTGLLGPNVMTESSTPVVVMTGVEAIAMGAHHACAIQNGGLFCWGENTFGQLGIAASGIEPTPTRVTGLETGVVSLALGGSHSCAIQNGKLKCFGDNALSQLGRNTVGPSASAPGIVVGLQAPVERVVAGDFHTCAFSVVQLRCWGWGANGALGFPALGAVQRPSTAFVGANVEPAAGGQNTCVIFGGKAQCWGSGTSGQLLGDASGPNPIQVLDSWVTGIGVGKTMICGERDAELYCWGDGSSAPTLINY